MRQDLGQQSSLYGLVASEVTSPPAYRVQLVKGRRRIVSLKEGSQCGNVNINQTSAWELGFWHQFEAIQPLQHALCKVQAASLQRMSNQLCLQHPRSCRQ